MNFKASSRCTRGDCVLVAVLDNGMIALKRSTTDDADALWFTRNEWIAFIAGVKNNEFDFGGIPHD